MLVVLVPLCTIRSGGGRGGGLLCPLDSSGLNYTSLGSLGENSHLNFFRAHGNLRKFFFLNRSRGDHAEQIFFLAVFMRTAKAGELVLLGAGGTRATAEEWDDLLVRNDSTKKPVAAIRADVVRNIGEGSFRLGVTVLRWRRVCCYSLCRRQGRGCCC